MLKKEEKVALCLHRMTDLEPVEIIKVLIFRESLTAVEIGRASCRSYSLQPGSYCRIIPEKRGQLYRNLLKLLVPESTEGLVMAWNLQIGWN